VLEQRFPVWCSFLTPSTSSRAGFRDAYGAPIDIGGVTIATGDYLLADRDGVVIVPKAIAEEVVLRTEESRVDRERHAQGADRRPRPVEAYNRFGKF
jgi:regulator of RNase E activity RraA